VPIINAWNLYGLRSTPFFQEELRAAPGAAYPVDLLFVGREGELARAERQIGGSTSSRVLVQGLPGLGKTSFVNRLKSDVATGGLLTHDQPIRITSAATPLGFTADVLRVLLRIHTSEGLAADRVSQPGATGITARLLAAGAIRTARAQGKSTYYVPTGDACIAFGMRDEAPAAPPPPPPSVRPASVDGPS
jgi:hypothetical protein